MAWLFPPISRHQNFRIPNLPLDIGTHPLIKSLSQRLKVASSWASEAQAGSGGCLKRSYLLLDAS